MDNEEASADMRGDVVQFKASLDRSLADQVERSKDIRCLEKSQADAVKSIFEAQARNSVSQCKRIDEYSKSSRSSKSTKSSAGSGSCNTRVVTA